jgi:hypothetical protein
MNARVSKHYSDGRDDSLFLQLGEGTCRFFYPNHQSVELSVQQASALLLCKSINIR